ncbi:MAG TPA: aspartate aminotransferase family protein [Limnobacter sp.]|nr:aspartate aminotransferase family protein [Limnobacter sp.]
MNNTSVFYRSPHVHMPIAASGHGAWMVDTTGRRYIDSCSGVAVCNLGYQHAGVIAALQQQANSLAYAYAGVFRNEAAEALADFLVQRSPGLSRAYFLCSGSEIMEIALKTALQYFVELGQPDRHLVISRRQNYHGSTLGVLAISGNRQRRDIFDPVLSSGEFVSPCYAYRNRLSTESDEDYVARLATELEQKILALGAERVAAFVAETVVGSTSGAVPPVRGYFKAVEAVCKRHGVLLILDEVMCGLGRTGHLFACQEDDVRPDIVTLGKGLAAGYQPISAMLVTEAIHGAIARGSGSLRNGQTFAFHATACATALAVQRIVEEEGLIAQVRQHGLHFNSMLADALNGFPHVGDIRGRGLFVGVEWVAEQGSTTPLPVDPTRAARVRAHALERGLLCYPMHGTIDGVHGDHVLFAPPFVSTQADLETMVSIFAEVARETLLH